MTKPSEWTAKWAWDVFREEVRRRLTILLHDPRIGNAEGFRAVMELDKYVRDLPFPSHPVERVSDGQLPHFVDGETATQFEVRLMAAELIERRAKDTK